MYTIPRLKQRMWSMSQTAHIVLRRSFHNYMERGKTAGHMWVFFDGNGIFSSSFKNHFLIPYNYQCLFSFLFFSLYSGFPLPVQASNSIHRLTSSFHGNRVRVVSACMGPHRIIKCDALHRNTSKQTQQAIWIIKYLI